MEQGASAVLAARGAQAGGTGDVRRATPRARRRVGTALTGLRDTCALACVALLGCLALVALGTVASLLWMLVAER